MARKILNLGDPIMAALKAVNSISGKSVTEEDIKKQRASMERLSALATPSGGYTAEAFEIEGMPCEWVEPELAHNPKYVILYAHGGGYTCGGLGYARILAAKMAVSTGLTVLSFDYRLAPEHTYPAPLEDASKAWDYLMQKGYGADHVLLAGDSAGGNLVLCLTQKLKKEERKLPKALILFSPWTDMAAFGDSYEKYKDKDPILNRDYITASRDVFIGEDAEPADPRYSPVNGDLSDFPTTLIQVGKNEILLDDSVRLSKRIIKAGGKAMLDIEKDGWHVYQQMPIPLAGRAMKRVSDFVSDTLYS